MKVKLYEIIVVGSHLFGVGILGLGILTLIYGLWPRAMSVEWQLFSLEKNGYFFYCPLLENGSLAIMAGKKNVSLNNDGSIRLVRRMYIGPSGSPFFDFSMLRSGKVNDRNESMLETTQLVVSPYGWILLAIGMVCLPLCTSTGREKVTAIYVRMAISLSIVTAARKSRGFDVVDPR